MKTDQEILNRFQEIAREELLFEGEIKPGEDVFEQMSAAGEDCDDVLFKFTDEFEIDMSDFLFYFHYENEFATLLSNRSLGYIPITIELLVKAAQEKKWPVEYPDHKPPDWRRNPMLFYPVMILAIVVVIFAANFLTNVTLAL
ncbi:MAG: DUF1493 family protein [Rhizobiaceae bacterium]|nr:DUF1493 family protein [Rhizobiaceae bacterium]